MFVTAASKIPSNSTLKKNSRKPNLLFRMYITRRELYHYHRSPRSSLMCMIPSLAFGLVVLCCLLATAAVAQEHNHTAAVSGVPQGVPYFCENPTVTSVAGGAWSDAKTWSTDRLPGANDKVRISAGHSVTFDA